MKSFKVGVKPLRAWFFRYYKVVKQYVDPVPKLYVLELVDGSRIMFPLDQVVIKLTKSWYEAEKAKIIAELGTQVHIEPQAPAS